MKIIEADAGVLTNFEVIDFLRSRGATVDPMGCLGAVAPSECKVFDYLMHTAACNQSREIIDEFMKRTENFMVEIIIENYKPEIIDEFMKSTENFKPEIIDEFMKRTKNFKLTQAEKFNLINARPSSKEEAYSIIEQCGERLGGEVKAFERMQELVMEELVRMVTEVLPPRPQKHEVGDKGLENII